MKLSLFCLTLVFLSLAYAQQTGDKNPAVGDDKPRVFITDSQSWEMMGSAGGTGGTFGAQVHGGARPQTAEIIKTFGEKCPGATVNNKKEKADYIVVLDHEGGKGYLRHKNKVAVFEAESGDSIVSKSTLSLGGSVEEACRAILARWSTHKRDPKEKENAAAATAVPADPPSTATNVSDVKASKSHLVITSIPDGADIEIDGDFVGNTPSSVDATVGEHVVSIKKAGYKSWERKVKTSGGEISLKAELEKLP